MKIRLKERSINNNTDYLEYTIQKGDVLSEIAIRFGVTVESIKVTNNIGDNPIYPGQIIYVYLKKFMTCHMDQYHNSILLS